MSRPTALAMGEPETTIAVGADVARAWPLKRHPPAIPLTGGDRGAQAMAAKSASQAGNRGVITRDLA
jgi:hypothetical protein